MQGANHDWSRFATFTHLKEKDHVSWLLSRAQCGKEYISWETGISYWPISRLVSRGGPLGVAWYVEWHFFGRRGEILKYRDLPVARG